MVIVLLLLVILLLVTTDSLTRILSGKVKSFQDNYLLLQKAQDKTQLLSYPTMASHLPFISPS